MSDFSKILIANRGEIAIRIMRAANEMGKKTVAVFAEEDKLSLIHISEPTRPLYISYAVFCLKTKPALALHCSTTIVRLENDR